MTRFLNTLLFLLHCIFLKAQTYQGPVPAPTSGYGSWGTNEVLVLSFSSPLYTGKNVEIFYPKNATTPRPTIFFSHAFGGEQSAFYIALLRFWASKGYAIVFSPYPTNGVDIPTRYNILWEGFKKAVANNKNLIDTTHVGFMGHSFGGGASFEMARRGFVDSSWGKNGKFIASFAPWYLFNITQTQLQNFPSDTKLLIQVYENDDINDHRMAIDAFNNIGIPAGEKDFIFVQTDQVADYTYSAEHGVPSSFNVYDAFDSYIVFRLTEALADYAFTGNVAAKNVALGNGSAAQITMPTFNGYTMKPLMVRDTPFPTQPESFYQYACSGMTNPRRSYCAQITTSTKEMGTDQIQIFPNPSRGQIQLSGIRATKTQVQFLNWNGQVVLEKTLFNDQTINIAGLPKGIYLLQLLEVETGMRMIKKLAVQ